MTQHISHDVIDLDDEPQQPASSSSAPPPGEEEQQPRREGTEDEIMITDHRFVEPAFDASHPMLDDPFVCPPVTTGGASSSSAPPPRREQHPVYRSRRRIDTASSSSSRAPVNLPQFVDLPAVADIPDFDSSSSSARPIPQRSVWEAIFASNQRDPPQNTTDNIDRSRLYFVEHTRGSLTSSNCGVCRQRIARGEIRLGFRRRSTANQTHWIHVHCIVAGHLCGGPSDILFSPQVSLFAREQILTALRQSRAHAIHDPPVRWLYSPAVSQRWQPYRSANTRGYGYDRAAWDTLNRVTEVIPHWHASGDGPVISRAAQEIQRAQRAMQSRAQRPSMLSRILDMLPPNRNFESTELCSICHDDYEKGEAVMALPCGHVFHKACITKWFQMGRLTCPMDQMSVPEMLGIPNE